MTRTVFLCESRMRTETASGRRSLMRIVARPRAQPHFGEKPFFGETTVPKIGLFVSFSRSVTAKAAAVATSRPTRVAVVRSRCKA